MLCAMLAKYNWWNNMHTQTVNKLLYNTLKIMKNIKTYKLIIIFLSLTSICAINAQTCKALISEEEQQLRPTGYNIAKQAWVTNNGLIQGTLPEYQTGYYTVIPYYLEFNTSSTTHPYTIMYNNFKDNNSNIVSEFCNYFFKTTEEVSGKEYGFGLGFESDGTRYYNLEDFSEVLPIGDTSSWCENGNAFFTSRVVTKHYYGPGYQVYKCAPLVEFYCDPAGDPTEHIEKNIDSYALDGACHNCGNGLLDAGELCDQGTSSVDATIKNNLNNVQGCGAGCKNVLPNYTCTTTLEGYNNLASKTQAIYDDLKNRDQCRTTPTLTPLCDDYTDQKYSDLIKDFKAQNIKVSVNCQEPPAGNRLTDPVSGEVYIVKCES